MSGNSSAKRVGESRGDNRPIPPKPSIEFERKQAKALLRQLRRGDPAAVSRAEQWHPAALRTIAPARIALADAQHVVAREYGFASWPWLIRYFRELKLEGSELGRPQRYRREFYDGLVDSLIREHRAHIISAGRALASFVPRFYGRSIDEVLATAIELDDARLAVARQNRCTSWEHLLSRAGAGPSAEEFGPVDLNRRLLGNFRIKTVEVQSLLDRGADPTWMPPNGVSVLEHALVRYWNGEAVDLIARRYLDRSGKPTPPAYRDRPPLGLMSPRNMPALPDPDAGELLLGTMLIATMNGRGAVIELLMGAGVPLDYAGWGGLNMLQLAVGNQRVALVETLVKLGADLDLKGRHPNVSARELARQRLEYDPACPIARRIVELCGCDPDEVLAAASARKSVTP